MNKHKTIGIIGGQGPGSTADFYMRVVKYYQDKLNAATIADYPPMVIFSVPTPDLIEDNENEEVNFGAIARQLKRLGFVLISSVLRHTFSL